MQWKFLHNWLKNLQKPNWGNAKKCPYEKNFRFAIVTNLTKYKNLVLFYFRRQYTNFDEVGKVSGCRNSLSLLEFLGMTSFCTTESQFRRTKHEKFCTSRENESTSDVNNYFAENLKASILNRRNIYVCSKRIAIASDIYVRCDWYSLSVVRSKQSKPENWEPTSKFLETQIATPASHPNNRICKMW